MGKKYTDPDWLVQEYVENERTTTELAEECGVTTPTIRRHLKNNNIQLRQRRLSEDERDAIRKRYRESELTQAKIADEFNISRAHVTELVSDIDRYESGSIYRSEKDRGYVEYQHYRDGEVIARFYEHQLIALLEHGYEMGGGNVVHHKNGWKLDNRPENLELTSRSDHQREELNGPIGNSGDQHWRSLKTSQTKK